MEADREALRRDLAAPAFTIAARRGKWALRGVAFPHVLFFVAAPARPGGPAGFLLRSECSGYSGIAPTSQLWHGGIDQPLALAHRPRGSGGPLIAFKDWGRCLYHPVDRLAAHHWPSTFDDEKWTPDKDITFLLETVYALLNCSDYTGADLPAAALDVPKTFMG